MLKDDFDDPAKHPNNVRIVAVQKIDSYIKCLKCNSKMAEEDSEIGECTRCHTYQNLSDCTKGTMASVVVKPSDGSTSLYVHLKSSALHYRHLSRNYTKGASACPAIWHPVRRHHTLHPSIMISIQFRSPTYLEQ